MDLTFERQGANTYLVYAVHENDTIDSLSLGMITNNKIKGLAPVLFTQMDEKKFFKYIITAKISVKQFFLGFVTKKRLLGVFSGITDAMIAAQDYMIDTKSFILDTEYIFSDVSTCETILICLPVVDGFKSDLDIGSFFKNIIFSIQFDQTESCDYVAKIISYLNSDAEFSLNDFKNILDELLGTTPSKEVMKHQKNNSAQPPMQRQEPVQKPIQRPKHQPAPPEVEKSQPIPVTQTKTDKGKSPFSIFGVKKEKNKPQKPMQPKIDTGFAIPGMSAQPESIIMQPVADQPVVTKNQSKSKQVSAKKSEIKKPQDIEQQIQMAQPVKVKNTPEVIQPNFGNTTILANESDGMTSVLGAEISSFGADVIQPHMIRIKNNERIIINKPVFRIGKEKSYVDYCINDNKTISRSHANIICRDNEYFVQDTNSTNYTYVNEKMIRVNTEVKLVHGDKIRFANENFEFKMYREN